MKKKILSIAVAAGVILSGGEFAHASLGDNIIKTGHKYLGTPYKYGSAFGNTRTFDCSSFTSYVFAQNGITIPRTSVGQASAGVAVSKANLQKGDLVFYDTDFDGRVNHAGIYAGNGKMLNAQSNGVAYTDAFSKYYWGARYITGRRVITQKATASAAKKPVQSKPAASTAQVKVHKVQKGETLWSISKKYKTTVSAIQKLNNLKSTSLKVGQVLKVSGQAPAVKKASTVKIASVKKTTTVSKASTTKTISYTVKRGNSLWGISKSYGVSVNQIMKTNKLKSASIYPGQKLIISK
ncbi:LysM peptidoglycan-binding domain-containing protein [Fictibacillus sp. b24]|uniref:LysM peptidoglycan-binding domain-containing protein n=1 Tax=Fictibacillus sp. b24 TaxID=3055863 RepID=UPI0025A12338|nr:LysM peptidoglycan-binding domain-containing protein [Fictibacillus sp. b24]MDM5315042.1 LysM peptidoglycan-binding domain-containing protein [Fictibacillus sp. b24]